MKSALLIVLWLSFPAFAAAQNTCLEQASSIAEIKECGDITREDADRELNRVYLKIREVYKDDPNFLAALKKSQNAWIKFRDAEYEARYPEKDKNSAYGSGHAQCAMSFETSLTLQRIVQLKLWLVGIEEGDLCSGSVRRPVEIRERLKTTR